MPFPPPKKGLPSRQRLYTAPKPQIFSIRNSKSTAAVPLQSQHYYQSPLARKPTLFSIRTSNSTAADTASAAAFPFFNRGARTRSETRHGQRRGVCCKKLGAVHPFSCATSHGFGTILGACCLEGRLYATGHPLHL